MIANPNLWVFAESSSVSLVVMAVLWEVLGATPSPVLMQQTATLTESLRNGMRDRLWLNVCGWGVCAWMFQWVVRHGSLWFFTDVFVILLFWLIVCFFHLHWGSLGSAERMGEESRKERWNRTFLSCETPTTNGCFWNSLSPVVPHDIVLNFTYTRALCTLTVLSNICSFPKETQRIHSWAPSLPFLFINPYVSFYFLNLSPPFGLSLRLDRVPGGLYESWAIQGEEESHGKSERAREREKYESARGEKMMSEEFRIALNPHRPSDSLPRRSPRLPLCSVSPEKLRTIARARSAAASCYCLWAWLSLCISSVHLKAQWKQIEWICCGQRNVCVCVCVWMTDYTEREKERRRNGNFRGGEAMLTLSCCQTQGVESEEGVMKKKRERERCGVHCLL